MALQRQQSASALPHAESAVSADDDHTIHSKMAMAEIDAMFNSCATLRDTPPPRSPPGRTLPGFGVALASDSENDDNDDDTAAMPATQSKKLQPIKVTNKHVYVRRV